MTGESERSKSTILQLGDMVLVGYRLTKLLRAHGYQAYCTLYKPEEAREAIKKKDLARIDQLYDERNQLMARLEHEGIATRQGTHAVHALGLYRKRFGLAPDDCPNA